MKKRLVTLTILCAGALLLLTSCATVPEWEGTLKVGWGKRSIAVPGPVLISGQFYLRVAHGQSTPILASALALEDGKDAVVFVSCDVVSVNPAILLGVQELLKQEVPGLPADKLIINATHTHAGPTTHDYVIDYPNKAKFVPTKESQRFIIRQIADAVKEAWENRAPGAIAYGYGFATTGQSRRVVYLEDIGKRDPGTPGAAANGFAKMYGKTDDPLFASFEAGADPFVNLLYTFDVRGRLTGAVVNVPCPSQTNEGAWSLHASFWHNVREKLHAKYGDIGVVTQCAAAGDLSPHQMYYQAAAKRRLQLKYPEKLAAYLKNPMPRPVRQGVPPTKLTADSGEVIGYLHAEDIANRIIAAFDEVLSWAAKEKFASPVLRHEVRTVRVAKRMLPPELVEAERRKHAEAVKTGKYLEDGDPITMLMQNSMTKSFLRRMGAISERYAKQRTEPDIPTVIHAVRIGDAAFTTCRFELFMDYMHRIQGRSPFTQTFLVQLTADPYGSGTYLATERAENNKGYSAYPYSTQVSSKGGQQLVDESVKMLQELKK